MKRLTPLQLIPTRDIQAPTDMTLPGQSSAKDQQSPESYAMGFNAQESAKQQQRLEAIEEQQR